MLDLDVHGAVGDALEEAEVRRLCELTAVARGIERGHVAVEFVSAERIAELNAGHRGKPEPTDVLSFPIDGVAELDGHGKVGGSPPPPRELGDIVICPEHTADLREALVHGMLHLLGMDHETDHGEMLTLQRELLAAAQR